MSKPFANIAIIGLGLLGGSIGLAVRHYLPEAQTTGFDLDPATRARAAERGLVNQVCNTAAEAVTQADLVIFCVPPGAMGAAAAAIAGALPKACVVSDVGSCKVAVAKALTEALPGQLILLPWGFTYDLPANYNDLESLANLGNDALKAVHGTV